MTHRIVGLDKAESDVLLNYLCDVYENVSQADVSDWAIHMLTQTER